MKPHINTRYHVMICFDCKTDKDLKTILNFMELCKKTQHILQINYAPAGHDMSESIEIIGMTLRSVKNLWKLLVKEIEIHNGEMY